MSSGYNAKSCNALEKPFYRPVEAAIRWCNLVAHEEMILSEMEDAISPGVGMFPQWPCLRANAERVFDALLNKEIPPGRDGVTVQADDHVAPHRLTCRHADLKEWMQKRYPDQKPTFLFDEIEQTTHSSINADAFRSLQADRDALTARIKKATEAYRALKNEKNAIVTELDLLRKKTEKQEVPGERAENTYLNIIGGLLGLMLGKTPAGKSQSVFESQAAIIEVLLAYHGGKQGIATRTLQEKFAASKRAISTQ